jgi:hypothetical protein
VEYPSNYYHLIDNIFQTFNYDNVPKLLKIVNIFFNDETILSKIKTKNIKNMFEIVFDEPKSAFNT